MKILILSVSKKDTMYSDASNEYQKRLSRYVDMEMEQIPHSNKIDEGDRIIAKVKATDYVILMDERGSIIKSEAFAELIDNRMNDSVGRMVIIIGGAYGVSDKVAERANYTLSFGKMVWPHALCNVMLLEQVYRSYTILNGVPYHNE